MVFELVTDSAGNVGGENGKVNMLKKRGGTVSVNLGRFGAVVP